MPRVERAWLVAVLERARCPNQTVNPIVVPIPAVMVKGFKRHVNRRTVHVVDNHRAERPLLMSHGEGR
ncbi:hypothetical protein [Furfurilactobacillus milii]|uniref:Uncharacterized protein n=1 Tax=Furfurilactobacillus rossiae TaxID=231049 RepID=A0A7C9MPF8_9LACO|nr:hypothetical protein [Furfurilactobacillus milii]MYV05264.1 hypothetical protein [Furfurilactobacillus milii]